MEYTITVRLLVNNVIDVAVKGLLYEGTDESSDDLDGRGDATFLVEVGQTGGATLTVTNTQEDDPDEGRLQGGRDRRPPVDPLGQGLRLRDWRGRVN